MKLFSRRDLLGDKQLEYGADALGSCLGVSYNSIEEGFIQKRRPRSSLLFGGQNLFNSFPR